MVLCIHNFWGIFEKNNTIRIQVGLNKYLYRHLISLYFFSKVKIADNFSYNMITRHSNVNKTYIGFYCNHIVAQDMFRFHLQILLWRLLSFYLTGELALFGIAIFDLNNDLLFLWLQRSAFGFVFVSAKP